MSATVGGVGTLARWLRAQLFLTNYRPVPLVQFALTRTAK
jgi:replicative superfamily II helicase